jgi:methylmalonyl-CoA mutase N-terminal domain/subunit
MNNVARVTIQALAAVLGGTQSLHTNSMDEALALPSQMAAQVALRTQQIIAYESGVADAVDPLAGSYLIEALTDQLEEQARILIEKIDALGGALPAIETGYIQQQIQDAAYTYQGRVEREEQIIVGVNKFTVEEKIPIELLRVDPAVEQAQVARLSALRAARDSEAASAALARVETSARSAENMMPIFIAAVESGCTLGEICGVLRSVFGEYQPATFI